MIAEHDQPLDPSTLPDWWEDPDLAAAVAEVDQFVGQAGWDQTPALFALVPTEELRRTQPQMADHLAGSGAYTPILQDGFDTTDLEASLASISWPDAVAGCVLVREIVVLPPPATSLAQSSGSTSSSATGPTTPDQAAAHPDRTEARLTAGVLRAGQGGACLLRVRHTDRPEEPAANDPAPTEPLRGGDLAPGLIAALQATFR